MTIHVLHVMPHMGLGVGKALSGLAIGAKDYDPEIEHEIIVLQKPYETHFIDKCTERGVKVHICPDKETTRNKIIESDILQVEWWHHPLSYQFLSQLPKFPIRMIMWDHVNGCYHPYLRPELTQIPNRFIFTSPYSYDNLYWTYQQREMVKETVPSINSSSGTCGFTEHALEPHAGFNIGWLGASDYVKLSPQFVEYCAAVADIPGIRFFVIGPDTPDSQLRKDVKKYELEDKFFITGFIEAPWTELTKLDATFHFLNPKGFDTTCNALLEQMSMGIPPIVSDIGAGKYIIKPGTGFIVRDKLEFSELIRKLYDRPDLRRSIGNAAKEYVLSEFSRKKMVQRLHAIYHQVLENESARVMDFRTVIGITPFSWFKSCCAPDPEAMSKEIRESDGRQSPRQFAHYFPEDQGLQDLIK